VTTLKIKVEVVHKKGYEIIPEINKELRWKFKINVYPFSNEK